MNNKLIVFANCLLLIVYCLLNKPAYAFKEMDDYLFQQEQYRRLYDEFVTSKDKYLKYKALNVQKETTDSLKNLLPQRNQVIRTYFLALRAKLRSTSGVIEKQNQDNLIGELDKKIIWLEEQSQEVEKLTTPTLADLFVLSDRIEDKEKEIKLLGYQSLAEMILGKIRTFQQQSVTNTALIKDEINNLQQATQAAQLKLWIKEVEVKNYLSQKEIEAAEINLASLEQQTTETEMSNYFNNLKIDCEDAKINLSQAISFQKEILEQLNHD